LTSTPTCSWLLLAAATGWLCLAATAEGARLHVLPGGERSSGSSTPDDWSVANCYPTLAAAALAASVADTLLLSRDDHAVGTEVRLTPAARQP
jgi:hypothetical protein